MRRGGYVKLFRSLADDPLWTRETFTRGQAWADLLMLANYKPGHVRVRGCRVRLQRGQVGWSVDGLAARWGWSRGKVTRFLNELEHERQIGQQKNAVTTVVTIINYNHYQQSGSENGSETEVRTNVDNSLSKKTIHENESQNEQQNIAASPDADTTTDNCLLETEVRTDVRRKSDSTADGSENGALIKKEELKNGKKEERARFVKPTLAEVEAYCRERGKGVNAQRWYDHYESNGWKVGRNPMRDWKAAVRKWENSDYDRKSPSRVTGGQRHPDDRR